MRIEEENRKQEQDAQWKAKQIIKGSDKVSRQEEIEVEQVEDLQERKK